MSKKLTGNQIRQDFIDFFVEHGHTAVPSMSLVPGGDSTLLFTNSGMVQFKDVFLGTDKKPYTRAVDSQKCMRVAGKHNDLEDVGRDDTHHTFFEMLGNWSFGDYYKKEAIAWSWQLLTEVWSIPKDKLYATCFEDDSGSVPRDDEAADAWKAQPGINPDHVLFFGRKENFWQMAETGPCGPCSEIHIDLGEERDNLRGQPHRCGVNGECTRFLELWNNVFIQYNLFDDGRLEPLPQKHVDTGMGFERIVAVLQGVDSNYKTDLFTASLEVLRSLTGHSEKEMLADFTPYRVICDHVRSAAFLIADGVVPGNAGRNYVARMIVRRAARFGSKIGLNEPFLAKVAEAVIAQYGDFYPELKKSQPAIFDNLTREEIRFARTVEAGTAHLQNLLSDLRAQPFDQAQGKSPITNDQLPITNHQSPTLDGHKAFDLYATYGLPFEISRDIAREQGLDVDEAGFNDAKERHAKASGGGKAMGKLGGEDAEFFAGILKDLQAKKKLGKDGVEYDPYNGADISRYSNLEVLALVVNGQLAESAELDDPVEVILPKTGFYIEAGGQVDDTGYIKSLPPTSENLGGAGGGWEIEVTGMRRASAGVIVHIGTVIAGQPKVGDKAAAEVDATRRHDIMRNHTATHLLHKALHEVLSDQAKQAGSLVAPTHLRFDFNHPEALTPEQIERVERMVNEAVAADMPVVKVTKSLDEAKKEGAMALFGEKYGETVRTISILETNVSDVGSDAGNKYSYELCGGTHLERTSDIGAFIIVSESSAAAGVRRIEAVTGRGAYDLIHKRFKALKHAAALLKTSLDDVPLRVDALQDEVSDLKKELAALRSQSALSTFNLQLSNIQIVKDINVLGAEIPNADADTLRLLADKFREKHPKNGAALFVSGNTVIATVTEDAVKRGIKAGDLITGIGGRGGGRPNLAQGSLNGDIRQALEKLPKVVEEKAT
ncbi:MAG: alanine--tRNA ligase [Chloroflexi bacterium CFX1]|nr:alanine--tRNA ligase [Chloroflexi bacterium CFX1]MCQ3954148.1 alanine--tRNA ligase [Chloroflexota bacterium]MDL1920768.1 alanine--tRNA ligase [Chloroflexi bacterium CFX5]NUQ60301.1 alanine--tRNA ligase [Anaerolineales bacterium]